MDDWGKPMQDNLGWGSEPSSIHMEISQQVSRRNNYWDDGEVIQIQTIASDAT